MLRIYQRRSGDHEGKPGNTKGADVLSPGVHSRWSQGGRHLQGNTACPHGRRSLSRPLYIDELRDVGLDTSLPLQAVNRLEGANSSYSSSDPEALLMGRSFRSLVLAMLAAVAGALGSVRAQDNAPHSTISAEPLFLTKWTPCGSAPNPPIAILPLCTRPGSGVDRRAGDLLKTILTEQTADQPTLCAADNTVVEANQCLYGYGARSVFTMADLMIRLAYNWRQQGELERAEQLAHQANALLEAVDETRLQRISALREWAVIEMERGELQHAAELADREADFARKFQDEVRGSPDLLIEALVLKASVLEKLGLFSDAARLRQEADDLKSK